MIITNINVVNEASHPVIWDFYEENESDPFSVVGRTYQMAIRAVPGVVTPGTDVVFACNAVSNRAECIGNCSTLTPGVTYTFGVLEDDVTIITGTCTVTARVF